ncbi:damage-inducible protein DinB [Maribacter sp. 2307ULW6-5]|uniref:damage-inducible protein DinB n=1 Tax=Maribacter sp. 2307ULW6-5 TaxID=3386275 RepID=UPI0039BC6CE3
MKPFFNELFDYNFYCNKKIIEHCVNVAVPSERTEVLFSELLCAHHNWNSRILGKKADYGLDHRHATMDWEGVHYENQRTSFEITTNADHFDVRVDYENSQGRLFTNTLKEMLFQIINQATYYRGQIAVDFVDKGLEVPFLDYAIYKR